jgi:hypothetical protein
MTARADPGSYLARPAFWLCLGMLRFSALLLACAILLAANPVRAQAEVHLFDFGSADAPTETLPSRFGALAARTDVYGGPSYIGVEWRTGVGFDAEATAGPFSLGLGGRLHVGTDGLYEPDTDEPYDALRLLRYARLDPTPRLPAYARIGPLTNVTLGHGHLVHQFQTTTAWDERTVGAEAAAQLPWVRLVAFADDVRLGGLVGGRATLAPFPSSLRPRLRSLRVSASAVTDLGLPAEQATTAFGVDARFALLQLGDFALSPFASYAQFLEYGRSVGTGVEFASRELIGLGRLGATLGFFQSGEQFIPGYFNAFYALDNPRARIWEADAYYRARDSDRTVGIPLTDAASSFSVYFRVRALVFDAFELSTFVRRAYSDDPLSEAGLRLILSPNSGDPFRFIFEVQRQGRTSFGSLFDEFRDQNHLIFHLDYALSGPLRLFIRSRYGYARVDDGLDGTARFLVERRFEPFVGVRVMR